MNKVFIHQVNTAFSLQGRKQLYLGKNGVPLTGKETYLLEKRSYERANYKIK